MRWSGEGQGGLGEVNRGPGMEKRGLSMERSRSRRKVHVRASSTATPLESCNLQKPWRRRKKAHWRSHSTATTLEEFSPRAKTGRSQTDEHKSVHSQKNITVSVLLFIFFHKCSAVICLTIVVLEPWSSHFTVMNKQTYCTSGLALKKVDVEKNSALRTYFRCIYVRLPDEAA